MEKYQKWSPAFDDIVFTGRNTAYGAYVIRRKYRLTLMSSTFAGAIIMAATVIIPYINTRAREGLFARTDRNVEIKMDNLDQAVDQVVVPPVPPAPPADVVEQQKYIPPVVVDSVKPEEQMQLMTADEAKDEVQNTDVLDVPVEVREEVRQAEAEEKIFIKVEEDPSFPGGEAALYKYISEHINYPEVARENNIQGKIIVRFCVTPTGGISQVSVLKGVDPELDAEAIRVVKTLPPFKPGKQGGKPVPVWYVMPIRFQLMD
ncbi:MAG TPA: energy transducer TonB [Bacteroidales bacterium]|nr:energy transducer TonB [Bacteroidales bacterium]